MNDKWLIINTDSLKKAYSPIQSGDEIYDPPHQWAPCRSIGADMTDYDNGFRRLRSKSWLKASEHPIRFPAYVCAPSGNVFYLATADNAPQTGTPAQWLWQPAPALPEPPAKEDACEKAWVKHRDGVMRRSYAGNVEYNTFKAGWEARGEK